MLVGFHLRLPKNSNLLFRTSSQGKWGESSTVYSLEYVEPMFQDVWSWISGSQTLLH